MANATNIPVIVMKVENMAGALTYKKDMRHDDTEECG